ncbi:MAG: RpiB/LacA/LacB family sugar-phosphate isomerase [Candidatus Woesearchaeota archaeon]
MKHIKGFIASDHRGFWLKDYIKRKYPLIDLGTFDDVKIVDEADYANALVKYVKREKSTGILICGSGHGMVIAANRHKGIRACLCKNEVDALWAREHTDANILVLAGEFTKGREAEKIINVFFNTKFLGLARYKRRIKKMG